MLYWKEEVDPMRIHVWLYRTDGQKLFESDYTGQTPNVGDEIALMRGGGDQKRYKVTRVRRGVNMLSGIETTAEAWCIEIK